MTFVDPYAGDRLVKDSAGDLFYNKGNSDLPPIPWRPS